MITTFTPRPWIWTDRYTLRPAHPNPATHNIHTILVAEDIGCGFVGSWLENSLAEGDANLALIAAAPDLYEAAQAAARVLAKPWSNCNNNPTNPEAVALFKLLAALEKASQPMAALMPSQPLDKAA